MSKEIVRRRNWQHRFQTFEEAQRVIRDWLRWYNEERPHQALGCRSPAQYRAQQVTQVACFQGSTTFRSAFMFYNLEWLHNLDVLYDASTFDVDPFKPQPDGVGTIFPFWVQRRDSKGYVELPYTLPQDSTLFVIFRETTIDLWKKKLDWVALHGGMALVIVHPDYMSFDGKPHSSEYPADLYEQLLKYVTSRYGNSCWYTLPHEVAEFAAQIKPRLAQDTSHSNRPSGNGRRA